MSAGQGNDPELYLEANKSLYTTAGKYPYVPGLTTYARYYDNDGIDHYKWWMPSFSAGVDCKGFLNRVATYTGSKSGARWDGGNPEDLWDTLNDSADMFYPGDNRSYLILKDYSNLEFGYDQNEQFDYPIIPGDIVLFDNGGLHHVAIVAEVQYSDDSTKITRNSVRLIEAAFGNNNAVTVHYNVMKDQTWWTCRSSDALKNNIICIRRMKYE